MKKFRAQAIIRLWHTRVDSMRIYGAKLLHLCNRFVCNCCIVVIYLIRPMLGPSNICPLARTGIQQLGCTQYALQQLEQQYCYIAWWNIAVRIFSCHPL